MDAATIDVIQSGGSTGSVAMRLLSSGFNVNALRTQATLQKDEWKHYDDAVVEVARTRLTGVKDLMEAGLKYNLPNAMGKTVLEWEKASDMGPAMISMHGEAESTNERIEYFMDSMPIPLVHKDFQLGIRMLAASRERGESLDTTQVRYATRKVVETIENTLFLGSTVLGTGKPLYGYTTQPQRNTGAVTANWATTATGEQMLGDVLRMLAAANADNMYGPFMLYVSQAAFVRMLNDFKASSDKSTISRLKEIPSIRDVRPSDTLTGTTVLLVQLTSDVVEIVDGIQPTLVEWESKGGFVMNFKVIAIMPPRFKVDNNNASGIVHFS